MNHAHKLNEIVFSEPTNKELRPYLVDYIKYFADQAANLSEDELLHGKGWGLASSICGALAWQGAVTKPSDSWVIDWVNRGGKNTNIEISQEDSGWITQTDEPALWSIFEITSALDIDSNDVNRWKQLFELVDSLS